MSVKSKVSEKWSCHWSSVWPANDEQLNYSVYDINDALEIVANFPVTLKDDKRSLVKCGELFGVEVIAKKPRDKNRRKWSRFLSLFRQSEALKTLSTLTNFWEKSIPSVKPICVFEKKCFGFVTDSWLFYEFKDGEVSDASKLHDIILLLNDLHRYGYRHDDPNFGNFLIDEAKQLFLIDCKGKSRLGSFSDCYDFILLSERNPDIEFEQVLSMANFDQSSMAYRFARFYALYKEKRTQLKKRIRR